MVCYVQLLPWSVPVPFPLPIKKPKQTKKQTNKQKPKPKQIHHSNHSCIFPRTFTSRKLIFTKKTGERTVNS